MTKQGKTYFLAGILASSFIFGFINYRHLHRPVTCHDCFFSFGLPFTAYQLGGFSGGAGFIWPGFVADVLVMLVVGVAIGWFLTKILRPKNS